MVGHSLTKYFDSAGKLAGSRLAKWVFASVPWPGRTPSVL